MGRGIVKADDEVYKTALFGSDYNSAKTNSYSNSWSATNNDFTVNLINFNNNNNEWSLVKTGSKNSAVTGTITTNDAIDKAVTKVVLTIDAITASKITSITLYTGTSSDAISTKAGTFTASTGTQTVTLSSPTADLFYKIEVVCTKGSSNGLISISKIEYYKASGPTKLATPVNLSATGVTQTAATLNWDDVTNALSYKVQYKADGADDYTTVSPNPTTNSCSLQV